MAQQKMETTAPQVVSIGTQKGTQNIRFGGLHHTVTVDIDARALFLSVAQSEGSPLAKDDSLFGTTIACLIGDGLLEFIQATFEQEMEHAIKQIQDNSANAEAMGELVHDAIAQVAAKSHYTRAFLPALLNTSVKACADYFEYIKLLQQKYRTFVAAAFEQSLYEEDIKNLTAATRFYFYCMLNETQFEHTLKRRMVCRRVTLCMGDSKGGVFTDDVSEGLPPAQYRHYLEVCTAMQKKGRTEPNEFERAYNLPATFTELNEVMPAMVQWEYELTRLDEMLSLELEQMLTLDLRVKRCKNCGRYFVLKGNYPTDYCDKIPPGKNKPCQLIAATNNYARKLDECPPLALYNREYKRLHARMRTGSLPAEQFADWKKKSKRLRDDCVEGKLTEQAFESALEQLRPSN